MNNNYKIVYSGHLQPGTDSEQFVQGFMQTFKVPEAQARQLVTLGRTVTLKENLEQAMAQKICQAMSTLGMDVHVEAMSVEPLLTMAPMPPSPQPTAAAAQQEPVAHEARCPKCGSNRVKGDDCLACGIIISRYRERQAQFGAEAAAHHDNPYAAPQSDVSPVRDADPSLMSGPHGVPAGNSWRWIAGGWGHFKQNPFAWLGAILVWIILMVIGSLIPFIGSIAVNLLAPVFGAGFLLGADEQRRGGNFTVGHLFSGFSNHTGNLVLLGLLYLLSTLLIVGVTVLLFGGALFVNLGAMNSGSGDPVALLMAVAGPLLLMIALWTVLMMGYWFAPALIALEGISPFNAMKLSFSACLKNMLPFLLYGFILIVLMILLILLMSLALPFGLGMIILVPVMMAAVYVSYRDIFYDAN